MGRNFNACSVVAHGQLSEAGREGVWEVRERMPKCKWIWSREEGEAVFFTIWADLNTKRNVFMKNRKFDHQCALYLGLCFCLDVLYEINTPDKSLFISQHGQTRLILKFLLWFWGLIFSYQHFIASAYKGQYWSLSKSNITSFSSGIQAGKATACGDGSYALVTQGLQKSEWGQI